jgi:periplasmic protein TonB
LLYAPGRLPSPETAAHAPPPHRHPEPPPADPWPGLERHKRYPAAARASRAEGVALLRFRLRRDASVIDWRLERSSGGNDLDHAVTAMIRSASPLPPPPPELGGDTIELVLPVRFALR